MLKYLIAYNNHEYCTKSTYGQHMECLNTSWFTTIMRYCHQEYLSTTQEMLKYLMVYNNYEYGSKSIYR